MYVSSAVKKLTESEISQLLEKARARNQAFSNLDDYAEILRPSLELLARAGKLSVPMEILNIFWNTSTHK